MTLSRIGRISKAFVISMAVVLGMSACGGYTVGFMWVTTTQYNQVSGFKIDDYTGNLTTMVNSPYSSGGTDPVSIAVRVGGNFVFVVNKGTTNSNGVSNGDGNVSVFAVGEDGILTFQASYSTAGNTPVWVASDNTGSYVYVLDAQAPDYATTGNGDITVFGVDGNTGRLQLVPNQLIRNAQGQQLNYFEVGPVPSMLRVGGTCVYTLDTGSQQGFQTIYSYGIGSNGQLVVESTAPARVGVVGSNNITSINVAGNSIYLTDSLKNQIIPYTSGSGCSLAAQVDGAVQNLPTAAPAVYTMTDSKNKFLYVLNSNGTNPNLAGSSVSAFVIESTGGLTPISDPNNPYPSGNGPTCMIEDPSNQYVFTSNSDGTVAGKYINQNTGQLSDLSRGSTFTTGGTGGTCLAVSGNVD